MEVHGVFQFRDRGQLIDEAFAVTKPTIAGDCVIRCTGFKQVGERSFRRIPSQLLKSYAESEFSAEFSTAIEPDGDQWQVAFYNAKTVEPSHIEKFPSLNPAILAGRKWLESQSGE